MAIEDPAHRIGAYRLGSDPEVDRAIALNPALEGFLGQDKDEATSLDDTFARLSEILSRETPMLTDDAA